MDCHPLPNIERTSLESSSTTRHNQPISYVHRETLKRSFAGDAVASLESQAIFFRGRILYAEHTYLHTYIPTLCLGKLKRE